MLDVQLSPTRRICIERLASMATAAQRDEGCAGGAKHHKGRKVMSHLCSRRTADAVCKNWAISHRLHVPAEIPVSC